MRTLFDLAALVPEAEIDEILQRAVAAGSALPARLREAVAVARGQGCRGPAVVARLLGSAPRPSVITSLERAVATLLRETGASFVREHPVHTGGRVYYVDFAVPHLKVAVEADGRRWHSDAVSFERDRERHNDLTAAGWRILRVTERQVRTEPGAVRGRVMALLVRP